MFATEKGLPIACNLTDAEFQERRRGLLDHLHRSVVEMRELENGFAYMFPSDIGWLTKLADIVALERQCCPFLRFAIIVQAADGPIWLEMTGPEGSKDFIASTFHGNQ